MFHFHFQFSQTDKDQVKDGNSITNPSTAVVWEIPWKRRRIKKKWKNVRVWYALSKWGVWAATFDPNWAGREFGDTKLQKSPAIMDRWWAHSKYSVQWPRSSSSSSFNWNSIFKCFCFCDFYLRRFHPRNVWLTSLSPLTIKQSAPWSPYTTAGEKSIAGWNEFVGSLLSTRHNWNGFISHVTWDTWIWMGNIEKSSRNAEAICSRTHTHTKLKGRHDVVSIVQLIRSHVPLVV